MCTIGCDSLRSWWQPRLVAQQANLVPPYRAHQLEHGSALSKKVKTQIEFRPPTDFSYRVLSPGAWRNSGLYLRNGGLRYCATEMKLCIEVEGLPRWTREDAASFHLNAARQKLEAYHFIPGPHLPKAWRKYDRTHMIATSRQADSFIRQVDYWQAADLGLPIKTLTRLSDGTVHVAELLNAEVLNRNVKLPDPWRIEDPEMQIEKAVLLPDNSPPVLDGRKMNLTKSGRAGDRRVRLYEMKPFWLVVTDMDPSQVRFAFHPGGFTVPFENGSAILIPGAPLAMMLAFNRKKAKLLIGNISLGQMHKIAGKYFTW